MAGSLGWGQPRPLNRQGKPGGAASNVTRIRRALTRLAGMDIDLLLSLPTRLSGAPQWKRYTVSYADFSAAATSKTVSLTPAIPANAVVNKLVLKHSTAFLGGLISAYTLLPEIGVPGFGASLNVFAAPGGTGFLAGNETNPTLGIPYDFSASGFVHLTANSTGANLNAATQGAATLWVEYSLLPLS